MKDSWRSYFRRLAVTTFVSSSVAWSSAMCYATQLAFDRADDPVYADGWQGSNINVPEGPAADNGGFGFEPWVFDSDAFEGVVADGIHGIDDGLKAGTETSSTFNDVGKAWRLAHPAGDPGLPRAGRGFPTLQVGQTMRVVVDNPSESPFFKGYFVRFNSRVGLEGGGNVCYGGNPCQDGTAAEGQTRLNMFEYFTFGNWSIQDNVGTETTLYDTDKIHPETNLPVVGTDMGMRVDVAMTGVDTYDLTMTPLDNPGAAFLHHGVLDNPGDGIDWIEFTFFNEVATDPGSATDFYIRSLEIFDDVLPAGVPGDYNNDNKVNAADYTVWRDHLNTSFQLPNEVSGVTPGMVTAQDYTEWKNRFGNMGAGGGAESASFGREVPEPSSLTYFVAASLAGVVGLRSSKRRAHDNRLDDET